MMKYIVKSLSTSKTMDFLKNKSYIFAHKRLTYITMEQKKIEHITLNLIVFGTIVIIGVLARQTVLHYGWDYPRGMLHYHGSNLSELTNGIRTTSFTYNREVFYEI